MLELTINQTGNSNHTGRMKLPVMAVGLGDTLIAAQATNGVVDNDAAVRTHCSASLLCWCTSVRYAQSSKMPVG